MSEPDSHIIGLALEDLRNAEDTLRGVRGDFPALVHGLVELDEAIRWIATAFSGAASGEFDDMGAPPE